jgi:hypothetical protein
MTLDTEHTTEVTQPAGYEPESVTARAWSWLMYAPAERVPWATAPVAWTAAEILHLMSAS